VKPILTHSLGELEKRHCSLVGLIDASGRWLKKKKGFGEKKPCHKYDEKKGCRWRTGSGWGSGKRYGRMGGAQF